MKKREELENLINNSNLFDIDRTNDAELFASVKRRFLSELATLMQLTRSDFDEIGLEIMQTARSCIKAYKADNGAFLNYFNAALKRTLFTSRAKQAAAAMRGGLTLDEKTANTIRQILKYAKTRGDDIYDINFQQKVADALDIPYETVKNAIYINESVAVRSGNSTLTNKDGDVAELFEFIAASAQTVEENLTSLDTIHEIAAAIDIAFNNQQERTKPLLKKMLTVRTIEALEDTKILNEITTDLLYWDSEIYTQYIINGRVPTERDISENCGILPASASRTLNTFIKKIRRKC